MQTIKQEYYAVLVPFPSVPRFLAGVEERISAPAVQNLATKTEDFAYKAEYDFFIQSGCVF